MAKDETPPWPRGYTFYNGSTIDSSNLGGTNLEGKEYRFEDTIYNTGQYVTVRVVRNSGSFALLPKRLVTFDTSYVGQRCNGYSTVSYAPCLPVDELLPTAGVVANDLFYVIMEGPCGVLTPLDAGSDNVIAVMDPLAAITAATSGATTAGRVATANTSGATTNQRDSLLNVVGRAMSAATTANTNNTLLMFATRWF
jgi:hypothetical protein